MPCNTAEQLMPQLPYAAILYVLIRCTPHAQDNNSSKIQKSSSSNTCKPGGAGPPWSATTRRR
eukprot:2975185-Alexandrium_andersonii.AAC.1